jgi:DNA-binding transcriptional LysR family regulator
MIAAAEALDMSRAMVTRYLAEMEEWAGARLLHRSTRRLSLTDAGDITLARCRRMLEVADDMAVAAGDDADTPQGLLRITCSQSLAQAELAGAVGEFLKRYPRTSVDLQMNNRAVNLIEERIDLALRVTNTLEPNLIARQLGHCDSVVCAAPSYLKERGTPQRPQDLAGHNCLTYTYFGKSLWQFTSDDGEACRCRSAATCPPTKT